MSCTWLRRCMSRAGALWLTVALLRSHGVAGLAAGLGLCHDLVTHFWDSMFPPVKRLRARMTLLQWLADSIERDLTEIPPATAADREPLELCQQSRRLAAK